MSVKGLGSCEMDLGDFGGSERSLGDVWGIWEVLGVPP